MGENRGESAAGQALFFGLWLAAGMLVFHGSLLWGGQVLCGRDLVDQYLPLREFQARAGFFAPWSPGTFSGRPVLGDIQTGFLYPLNWLFLAGPAELVYTLLTMFHLWFGGMGLAFFLSRWLQRPASLFGAICWAFGSYQLLRLTNGVVIQVFAASWIPWMLLAAERQSLHRSGLRWTAALAIFGAFQLAAGMPQLAQITWFGLGIWTLVRMILPEPEENRWLTGAGFLAAGAAALAVNAPALAAVLAFQSEANPRGTADPWGFLSDGSLAPQALLTWIFPNLFASGNSEEFYWGSNVGYAETAVYLGVLPLALALWGAVLAMIHRRAERLLLSAALIGVLGLWIALGAYGGLFYLLTQTIPTFDLFRVPARWTLWPALAIAIFASWAFNEILAADEETRRQWQKPWLITGISLVVVIALFRALMLPLLNALGLETVLMRAVQGYPARPELATEQILDTAASSVQFALGMAILALGLIAMFLRSLIDRKLFVIVLIGASLLDLRIFWTEFTTPIPADARPEEIQTEQQFHRIARTAFRDYFYPETEAMTYVKQASQNGRVHYDNGLISFFFDQNQRELLMERPRVHDARMTRGYQQQHLRSYVEDYYHSFEGGEPGAFMPYGAIKNTDFLDAYNITAYLNYPAVSDLSSFGFEDPQQLHPAGLSAWKNGGARGWAWVSQSEDFLRATPDASAQVTVSRRESAIWEGRAKVTSSGWLHLSTPEYSRWELILEGPGTAEIRDSRSAYLPAAGEWTFRRVYRSPAWNPAPLAALALGWLAILSTLILGLLPAKNPGEQRPTNTRQE